MGGGTPPPETGLTGLTGLTYLSESGHPSSFVTTIGWGQDGRRKTRVPPGKASRNDDL